MDYLGVLLQSQGEWRSRLLWRLLGYSMIQLGFLYVTWVRSWDLFSNYGLQWLFPAGLVLVLGGSRIGAIALSWILLLPHYATRYFGSAEVQLAEEYGLLLTLPVLGIGAILVGIVSAPASGGSPRLLSSAEDPATRRSVDETTVALFRVAAVSTLLWATLHKINTDFLLEAVSCGPLLARELAAWWDVTIPQFVRNATPWQIIAMEGLCALLLPLAPRLGLIWTSLVIGVIGHRGATAFVVMAVAVSLSFLRSGDKERLVGAARRYRLILIPVVGGLLLLSGSRFIGARYWYEMASMQLFVFAALLSGVYLLADDLRIRFSRAPAVDGEIVSPDDGWEPRTAWRRGFIVLVCLVYLLNGMAPYLGWKYRLSFAMLSNLRADDARWNSLIFPKSLRTKRFDDHIHIDVLHADYRSREILASLHQEKRALREGLISPKSLDYRMKFVRYHKLPIDLELTYKGKAFFFEDVVQNPKFDAWLGALPKTIMIQEYLPSEGPQSCTH